MPVQQLTSRSLSQPSTKRDRKSHKHKYRGDLTPLAMSCNDSTCSLARRDLKRNSDQSLVEWIARNPFRSFITLTLDDKKSLPQNKDTGRYNMVGIQKFTKAMALVLVWLTSCPDDLFVSTAWCLERQKRGALHAHLVSTCPPECAMWVKALWQLGFSDVKPYSSAHSKYLVGYLNKDSHFDVVYASYHDGYQHEHWGLTPTRKDWYNPSGGLLR